MLWTNALWANAPPGIFAMDKCATWYLSYGQMRHLVFTLWTNAPTQNALKVELAKTGKLKVVSQKILSQTMWEPFFLL